MPVLATTSYPSIQTITDLVRTKVRDDMAGANNLIGEGQILVDYITVSVTMANLFNSAARELSRQMRNTNAPPLIGDNYILSGIPPMNGPQGLAVADPSVQVYVNAQGYFDGSQIWSQYTLPAGCFQVTRVWERETGSNANFSDLGEPSDGLAGINQTCGFGRWEWRGDSVYLPGSLDTRDLRLRYLMLLQAQFVATANPANTYLPILDCEEAIAAKIVRDYSLRQGGALYAQALQQEKDATADFLNEQTRRKQGTNYVTLAYGSEAFPVNTSGV